MIEIFLQDLLIKKDKEHFTNASTTIGMLKNIIWLLISCYAVYLSWNCKTNSRESLLLRVIYAFIAWIFGIIYIFFYFFMFKTGCSI